MNLNSFEGQSYRARINFFMRGFFLNVITALVLCIRMTGGQDKQQLSVKQAS